MIEPWLCSPTSSFHNLVENTKVDYPLVTDKETALKYLQLINDFGEFYTGLCNYDLIDYPRLIYIEEHFKTDEEVMTLVNNIKRKTSDFYSYKQKYLKRITNPIPREYFDAFYDEYLAKRLELNSKKYYEQRESVENNFEEGQKDARTFSEDN